MNNFNLYTKEISFLCIKVTFNFNFLLGILRIVVGEFFNLVLVFDYFSFIIVISYITLVSLVFVFAVFD